MLIGQKIFESRGKGAPFSGTCSILKSVSKDAGKNIANWLDSGIENGFRLEKVMSQKGALKLAILSPSILSENSDIPELFLQECHLLSQLSHHAMTQIQPKLTNVMSVQSESESQKQPLLKITALSGVGSPGGIWSGSKGLTINAQLVENDKVISQKTFTEENTMVVGPSKTSCNMFENVSKALGHKVSSWVIAELAASGAGLHPLLTAEIDSVRLMVKSMYIARSATEKDLDAAATRVIEDMNTNGAADHMSWICNLIGQSGSARYT